MDMYRYIQNIQNYNYRSLIYIQDQNDDVIRLNYINLSLFLCKHCIYMFVALL